VPPVTTYLSRRICVALVSLFHWAHQLLGRKAWLAAVLVVALPASALELNQATEAELDSLKGMGPALNRRVREARAQRAFRDWADFQQRVSGMGVHKARTFSEQGLTVQGQALTP